MLQSFIKMTFAKKSKTRYKVGFQFNPRDEFETTESWTQSRVLKLFTNEYQPTLPLLIDLKYPTGDKRGYYAQSDNHVTAPDSHVTKTYHISFCAILGNHSIVPKILKFSNCEQGVFFNESILLKVFFIKLNSKVIFNYIF